MPSAHLRLPEFAESLVHYRDALAVDPAERDHHPFTIEFAGMPNSGKTLCVDRLASLLRRAGFSCRTLPEQAALTPIPDAEDPLFNLWTATTTLANILEANQGVYDFIIVDRGVTDASFWFEWLRRDRIISRDDYETLINFLNLEWWAEPALTFVLTAAPSTALRRDYTDGLVKTTGGLMNRESLTRFKEIVESSPPKKLPRQRRVLLDSTRISPERLIGRVFHETLLGFSDSLDERIFAVPRRVVEKAGLRAGILRDDSAVSRIVKVLRSEGSFRRRSEVEDDTSLIQPIPVAYFDHRQQFLLLRRKDGRSGDRLHNRYSVWIGGHVRDRDRIASPRDFFVAALRREVSEELRIPFIPSPTREGVIWDPSNPRSEQHLALLYHIALKTKDVSVRTDQAELRLPRGSSVSGTFRSRRELSQYAHEMEPWSTLIIERLLTK